MLAFVLFAIIAIEIYVVFQRYKNFKKKYTVPDDLQHLKPVPVVEGGLPFVGHGIEFSKDIIGFVEKCYEKYGPIFRVKIFRTDMVIVCDRTLIKEFFAKKESDFSLVKTLNRLFFGDAFSEDEEFLSTIMGVVKKTIKVKFEDFIPKISEEANRMIDIIKKEGDAKLKLSEVMTKFVARTSANCFMCLDLTDEFYDTLVSFSWLLNHIVILTYFFPKWFLKMISKPFLAYYRNKMINAIKPLIAEYRNDLEKNDSMILRKSVDYVDPKTGNTLLDEQIGSIIVCLLYVSSENTALGLTATILDLATNPTYWNKVKKETKQYLSDDNLKDLFKNAPIIDICFKESCRMGTHIFPLNRYPMLHDSHLGEYYINSDSVGLCAPLLMCRDKCASDLYKNSEVYRPERFLEGESYATTDLVTFGASTHLCPGKNFAIMEIKMAVALIVNNFKIFKLDNVPQADYFSPSAFAEKNAHVQFELLGDNDKDDDNNDIEKKTNTFIITHKNKHYNAIKLEGGGILIRNFLDCDEQMDLFRYTIDLSDGTDEQKNIGDASPTHPYPIVYHNLVYTGTSNCDMPQIWSSMGNELWETLNNYKDITGFEKDNFVTNSVYCQLFSEQSKLSNHMDQHCDWGISVSIGASADFVFGNETIILRSGDIVIADFSKVEHGIPKVYDDYPGFMDEEAVDNVRTFGMARLSVQIRDIDPAMFKRDDMMHIDDFKKMVKSY